MTNNKTKLLPQKCASDFPRLTGIEYQFGINRLISSAQPLLIAITRLKKNYSPNNYNQFYETLSNELRLFSKAAEKQNYPENIINTAKIVLINTVKNIVSNIDHSTETMEPKIELNGENKDIPFPSLEELITDQTAHIDLLELVYICLQFNQNDNHSHLNLKQDLPRLYHRIKKVRGSTKKSFFELPQTISIPQNPLIKHFPKLFSGFLFLIIMTVVGVYIITDLNLAAMNTQLKSSLDHLLHNGYK
jgi:type IV/VI secretion system ImpK/VasF family protein